MDTLSDEEISHPLNEELLKEAEEIKEDREILKGRLDKLEATRSTVSDAVYQRVRDDYLSKLKQTNEHLAALRKGLQEEERHLSKKKTVTEASLKFHREKIEESELRFALGEFTQEAQREVVDRENQEIGRLEEALKILEDSLARHRDLFTGEEVLETFPELPKVSKPPDPPSLTTRENPPTPFDDTAKIRLDLGATDKVSTPPQPPPSFSSVKPAELLIYDNGKVSQTLPLDHPIQIGRSPSNDVVLKEPKVSRHHAEIQNVSGKYILLDLESSNGTFVAGKRITERVLQEGDEILIGNTKMVFKG